MPKKSRSPRKPEKSQRGTTARARQTAGSTAASAKQGAARKPKKASSPRDAAGIEELAGELRSIAETIDGYADAMRKMNIESIRPLTGNWDLAVAKIRDVIAKQILARLLVEAAKRGHEAHELFRQ